MFKIGAVTNRKLCEGDFLEQIRRITATDLSFIILREKDLSNLDYDILARQVLAICQSANVPCILHSHLEVAETLGVEAIHLPLPILRQHANVKDKFKTLGVSVHSVEEARQAEALGATYLTAGHIFWTDCKKGLEPRGVTFLKEVVENVSIPVYGIGGIHQENLSDIVSTGAAGACMMSEYMKNVVFKRNSM